LEFTASIRRETERKIAESNPAKKHFRLKFDVHRTGILGPRILFFGAAARWTRAAAY
jgi:hypothetical protein